MKGNIRKAVKSDLAFDIFANGLGIIIVMVVLIPLIFVVAASFSDPDLVIRGEVLLFPKGFTVDAYVKVFENKDIWRGFRNSCFYTVCGTAFSVILTVLAAYPLSRKNLRGRNLFMMAILFTMYFNGGMIPTYLQEKIWDYIIRFGR